MESRSHFAAAKKKRPVQKGYSGGVFRKAKLSNKTLINIMLKKTALFFSLFILSISAQAQSPASYAVSFAKVSGNKLILRSQNGIYTLIYRDDGNLCLNNGTTPIWNTMINGITSTKCKFQADGNLVIYNDSNAVWSSMTSGKGGYYISLQDDGNLCIYTKDNIAIWSTMTNGK